MARTSQGTLLQYNTGGTPPQYQTVATVTNFGGPSLSNPTIDDTGLEDTARQKLSGGLLDAGTVDITCNFKPDSTGSGTVHDQMVDKLISRATPVNFKLSFADFGSWQETFSSIDTGTDIITLTGAPHELHTGQPVQVASTGDIPAGLAASTIYYVRCTEAPGDEITLHPTNADAVANTNIIDITGAGSGTITIEAGSVYGFTAAVEEVTPAGTTGEALTATMTLNITGTVLIKNS